MCPAQNLHKNTMFTSKLTDWRNDGFIKYNPSVFKDVPLNINFYDSLENSKGDDLT
jgi:hypothetical protein